jgi:hypothetical protein
MTGSNLAAREFRSRVTARNHELSVSSDIRNESAAYGGIPRFERTLTEDAYPFWDSQKPVAICTHVML